MTRFNKLIALIFSLFILMFFSSCEKEMDKYYKIPSWLKGNVWEVLESKGDFTEFLKAVEKSGYKDVIQGRGIITVVAPTNGAFSKYLSENGYSSIDDIPADKLKELVGFHLVYYSFDKNGFANYNPNGVSSNNENILSAGLHYKFRTKSNSGFEDFLDNTVGVNQQPPVRKIYHKERFLPIFSNNIFKTKNIDAQSNYQYFFPAKNMTSDVDGFNIANTDVIEYAIISDNGYVYTVNEVLKPSETIFDELRNSANYTMFLDAYNRFSDFVYSASLSEEYGKGDSLYLYYHTDLPKIASEWSYNGESGLPDYADLGKLSRLAYNVFAPSNSSLTGFYNDFWSGYYDNINEVSFIAIKYLLDNHVFEGDIVFPEEIQKEKILTKYGDPIIFNINEVSKKTICTNGTLYGLDNVIVPRMFESITAPLFQRPQYKMFLHMTDQVSKIQPLMSDNLNFNFFIPSDTTLISNTTILGRMLQYQNLNPNKFGAQTIQIEGDDDPWVAMSRSVMEGLVNNHITTRVMSQVGNYKVLKTLNNFQYLLIENDTKVYSSNIFNNYNDRPSNIKKIDDYYNGTSYEIIGDEDMALVQDYTLFKDQIKVNTPDDLVLFKQLLDAGGLPNTSPSFNFLKGERFIVFAATEDDILADMTKLPALLPEPLSKYMKVYFISLNESGLSDYPFPGAGISGKLSTYAIDESGKKVQLELIDRGDKLQIKDPKGNIINVTSFFPRIYADAAVYMLDSLIEF